MTSAAPPIAVLDSIASLAGRYDVWLTDIWGVMHNGVRVYPGAVEACRLFREGGGSVILISNSPRPRDGVAEQLAQIGVPRDCYDGIVTSGDVTRALLRQWAEQTLFHLGPARDKPIFDGLPVRFGGPDSADVVVCSGLYDDETETPEDYAELLAALRRRDLTMICGNPDIVVERGSRLVYCAGALAEAYHALGGTVVYAGKPHSPIYDLARDMIAERRGTSVPPRRLLAIGDGVKTDVAGAAAQGIDVVYIASAVHMGNGADGLAEGGLSAAALGELFRTAARPVAAQEQLAW